VIEHVFTAPGYSPWKPFTGPSVGVAVYGTATSISIAPEISPVDPDGAGGAAPAPADDEPITGDPSSGMSVVEYDNIGRLWWRAHCTEITGTATVRIFGAVAI
jgi:hypothetical protein